MKKASGIVKSAVLVTGMTFSFKLLGFVKQAVIASFYGANLNSDAYFIAYGFVSGIVEAVVYAIGVSIISIYSTLLIQKGIQIANKLISGLLEIIIPIFAVISILVIIFSSAITNVVAPSYSGTSSEILSYYIKCIAPILVLGGAELVYSAVLDSHKSFFVPRLRSLIYSISVIISCFALSDIMGVRALIIAEYFSLLVYTIMLVCTARKYHHFSFVRFQDIPELKSIIITAVPLLIGNSAIQINQIVDKSIASGLEAGTTSSLSYCHTLEQFVTNVMIVNVGNVLFANFAGMVAEGKIERVKEVLKEAINYLTIIMVYVSIITVFNAESIVSIIYHRGNFSQDAVKLTSVALLGYAISFVPVAVRDLTIKSMYAYKDTKRPMMASLICIAINILFSITLSKWLGILGIALATSISAFTGMIINATSLKKHMPTYQFGENLKVLFRLIPSATALIVVCLLAKRITSASGLAHLLFTSVSGLIVYSGLLFIFEKKEIEKIVLMIKKKVKHRKDRKQREKQ